MANKFIFCILTCALALNLSQNVESIGFFDVALGVASFAISQISPSDIDTAAKAVQDVYEDSKGLRQNIKGVIDDISTGVENIPSNVNSFMTNLEKSIKNAGKELKDDLKKSIPAAIGQVRNIFSDEQIGSIQEQMNHTAEDIQSKAESLTSFLKTGLKKLSLALNKTQDRPSLKSKLRKKLNSAIISLMKGIASNSKVQGAILSYIVTLDEGSEVSTLKTILHSLGSILIKTGNPVLGAIALSIPTLAESESVSDILEPILITTIRLGLAGRLG